jgi:hypothetical protein
LARAAWARYIRPAKTRLDSDVALKVSKAEFTARFGREARTIVAFNHPNICQLWGWN